MRMVSKHHSDSVLMVEGHQIHQKYHQFLAFPESLMTELLVGSAWLVRMVVTSQRAISCCE
jgi:hypothetical protein